MKRILASIVILLALTLNAEAVVTSTQIKQSYVCNGVSASFSFPFAVYAPYDITVQVVTNGISTTLVPIGNYTVAQSTSQVGGTVNLTSPLFCTSGSTLNITRVTPETQTTSYKNNQYLNQTILMSDLDKIWMGIQELADSYNVNFITCNYACQQALVLANVNSILNAGVTYEPVIGVNASSGNINYNLPAGGVVTVCKTDSTANTVTLVPGGGQYVWIDPLSGQMECARMMLVGVTWFKQ